MARRPHAIFASASASLAYRACRGRDLAQSLDGTIHVWLDQRFTRQPLDGPMVARADGFDARVWMKITANALGLETERMQSVPKWPVNEFQPRELAGGEHTGPQPRSIEQLHQHGMRVCVTVGDRQGRGDQLRVAEKGIRHGAGGRGQGERGVGPIRFVLVRIGQTGR